MPPASPVPPLPADCRVVECADRTVGAVRSTTSEDAAMNSDDREKVLARFWKKVNKTDTCWLWTGYIGPLGYGRFYMDSRTLQAHRASFILSGRQIPHGLDLDHLCRVRSCVRPDHLEPVTRGENSRRSPFTVTSIHLSRTHCPHGHEYAGENLYVDPRGFRGCRACHRERERVGHKRRKASRVLGSPS